MATIKGLAKQAEGFFEKQLSLSLERKNPEEIIDARINLAEVLITQGQTDCAEKLLKEAIEAVKKTAYIYPIFAASTEWVASIFSKVNGKVVSVVLN